MWTIHGLGSYEHFRTAAMIIPNEMIYFKAFIYLIQSERSLETGPHGLPPRPRNHPGLPRSDLVWFRSPNLATVTGGQKTKQIKRLCTPVSRGA